MGLSLGITTGAFAQSAAEIEEDESDPTEIIVTANKRQENLRDVSISISAITTESLDRLGGDKFSEFLQGVAGVSTQDLGAQNQNVVFRGITSAPDGGSAVGIYFDELPFGGANGGIQIKPIDVERFEVLRGPQPILYGAGSLTGTLRLVPNRPNLGQAQYGADAGISNVDSSKDLGYDASAYVSVPLVADKLAVRLAGFVEREKGFVDNIRLNRKDGNFKSEGGRASIAFAPSENVNFLGQYIYQSNAFDGNSDYRPILSRANPNLGRFQIDRLATQGRKNVHLAGLTADAEMGGARLTSVTSYSRFRQSSVRDFTSFVSFFGLPVSEIIAQDSAKVSSFSQEVRLSNSQPNEFTWTIGAFYQKTKIDNESRTVTPDGSLVILDSDRLSKNRDVSVFGQVGYQLTPVFDVSAGARYTWFSREDNVFNFGVADPNNPLKSDTTSLNPQLTLTYKPDGKHTYYARVAKGYRAPNAVSSSTPGCVVPKLKSDQTINYELGSKLALGGVVNLNAAVYYIDWKDIPVFATPPGCGPNDSFLINAGNGQSYGLEGELVARLSDSLTLNTSVTLSKSKLGKVPVGFFGGVTGEQLPGNANLRMSGGLNYRTPISDDATLFADVSAVYVGPYKNFLTGDFDGVFKESFGGASIDGLDPAFLSDPGAGDYATVNLRLGIEYNNWSASIYANNALNSRGTSAIYVPLDQLVPGEAPFNPIKPRTIGLDVSVNF
jgi:iron complex outermembrane recepter protein